MKTCSMCNLSKETNMFSRKSESLLQSYCKDCQRIRSKQHYIKNKESYKQRSAKSRKIISEWLSEYKSNLSCSTCGESHIACLDFHHKDPSHKEIAISSAVNYSIQRIKYELEKCIVLCSNCHRKHHYNERINK